MNVLELLKGKKIDVMSDLKVLVEMEIASVESKFHSVDTGPSTPENDWWPPSRDWTTYIVTFTNGARKEYSSITAINVK